MGLDMGLIAKRNGKLETPKELEGFEVDRSFSKEEYNIFSWRKANAIHGWFRRTYGWRVDESDRTFVSVESLRKLLDRCNAVLDNPNLAKDLLPVQQGCFFGSYEYDEGYMYHIKETKEVLEKVIALYEADPSWMFYYWSSW